MTEDELNQLNKEIEAKGNTTVIAEVIEHNKGRMYSGKR